MKYVECCVLELSMGSGAAMAGSATLAARRICLSCILAIFARRVAKSRRRDCSEGKQKEKRQPSAFCIALMAYLMTFDRSDLRSLHVRAKIVTVRLYTTTCIATESGVVGFV